LSRKVQGGFNVQGGKVHPQSPRVDRGCVDVVAQVQEVGITALQSKINIALLDRQQIGYIVLLPKEEEISISHRHTAVLHGVLKGNGQVVLGVGSTPTSPDQGGIAHGAVQDLIDRGVGLAIDLGLLDTVIGGRARIGVA